MKISHWTDAFKALPEAAQKAKDLFSSAPAAEAPEAEAGVEIAQPVVTVEALEAQIQTLETQLNKMREMLALQHSEQQGVAAQLRQLSGEHVQLAETLTGLRKRTGYLLALSVIAGLVAAGSLAVVLMRSGMLG